VADADLALCLNAGSSSLKFSLFGSDAADEPPLATGAVEHLGTEDARAHCSAAGQRLERACANADANTALEVAFEMLAQQALPAPSAVGHRVVHGGPRHLQPARIDRDLIAELKAQLPLAPLHLPAAILGMEAMLERMPDVPQVACFDTSFHAHMPAHAARYALPDHFYEEGVRRYGFHGLSYEYVLAKLGTPPPSRLIVAHLGNGVSLAAIKEGRSLDTTMGFTPGGGIMMGTRAGDLDPGLLLYLIREKQYSAQRLEQLLERESGLLAVGGSADVRLLNERRARDPRADLAITMLGYAVRKVIGAYVAVLGGLDLLVFTGGIGEHSPAVREEACRGLEAMGVRLDPDKNAAGLAHISRVDSCPVQVIAADEDRIIARHTRAVLRG
jgi:acetate kinase